MLRLSFRAKFLTIIWASFFLLVAAGIHGAPTPELARLWSDTPYSGFLLGRIHQFAEEQLLLNSPSLDQLMMTVPPMIRSDDYTIRFPLALSQLSHNPRFPVINTNYWDGRNMLVLPAYDAPVWHISALARPGTWGYFFLGAQRGVTWQWWFQVFACFTALYLLFEIILRNSRLAAFGSFWFCMSAAVVCVGYWPTYVTFFGATITICCYNLLTSTVAWRQILCGVLLGLSVCGFVMILYPPWQVPLAYLFF